MYKNIIWDFDGTLFDTYPNMTFAFRTSLREENIDEDEEEISSYIKKSVSYAVEHYKKKYCLDDRFIGRFIEYEKNCEERLINPFPGAKELCEEIKLSGGSNFIFTHREKSTKKYLKYHNMLQYFTEIVTIENGFRRKPDPQGVTYLIEKYNIDKNGALGIGDREIDVKAFKNAGIKACLFNIDNVRYSTDADHVVESMKELYSIIIMTSSNKIIIKK